MRNNKGQFIKGSHWRPRKEYWDKDWLAAEYATRSAQDIAEQFGVTENAILFWLKKHGIKTRTMKEVRAAKHWGAEGSKNPMYGKVGQQNGNWKGGCSPERQAFYSSREWATACLEVWMRDGAICARCGSRDSEIMNVHHIVSFSVKELRADPTNLVLLCVNCHRFVHSKRNAKREFIGKGGDIQ